jgi:Transmembrane secretion effector
VAVATLNVSAQIALPDWVRGRGLAMFVTVFFGAMAAGSAVWGQAASMVGLEAAQFIAAAGLVAPTHCGQPVHGADRSAVDLYIGKLPARSPRGGKPSPSASYLIGIP